MATSFVRHKVSDYSAWRQVYDSVADVQREGGVVEAAVYRSVDDPNDVLVVQRFATTDDAHSFMASPALRDAMGKAGVDPSSLRIELYEED
ncbi:MAG: cyclase [Actinomycetota bacterium]|jgi:quinol monooxygenase YgiN|nr:cyclase [Actinomycetota bacterium]